MATAGTLIGSGLAIGATGQEIANIAKASIAQSWTTDGCAAFVWGVSNLAGVPFFDTRDMTLSTPLSIWDGGSGGYVVPHSSAPNTAGDGWSVVSLANYSVSTIAANVQVGDIVRVYKAGNTTEASFLNGQAVAHSFVVVGVSGGDVQVVDNWSGGVISQHSWSNITNAFASGGSFQYANISRIDSAYISANLPSTLQGWGDGDWSSLGSSQQANIVIDDLTVTSSTVVEDTGLSFTADLRNAGGASTGTFSTRLYLSTNSTFDTSDWALTTFSKSLAAGATTSYSLSVPLPNDATPGQYYLIVWADYDNQVTESNNNDNSYSIPITIAAASGGTDNAGNTLGAATTISIPSNLTGSVGVSGDTADWWRFVPQASGVLTVDLTGLSADIDVTLYNSAGSSIVSGNVGGPNSEHITANLVSGQTYYLQVFPYVSNTSSNYSLSLSFSGGAPQLFTEGNDNVVLSSPTQNAHGLGGNDTITGSSGADSIFGDGGNDLIDGAAANDTLYGGTGSDILFGGSGNDFADAGDSDDGVVMGDGADTATLGDGNDYAYGGTGDDALYGDAGSDVLVGEAGNDLLTGGSEQDYLYGGADDDALNGGAGIDVLIGDIGNDDLQGGLDNDYLYGGLGNDVALGGAGADLFVMDDGDDIVFGEDGNDFVYAGAGNDQITGGGGSDIILGEAGDDIIDPGLGVDYIFLGTGNDTLKMSASASGVTVLYDFTPGVASSDVIVLSGTGWSSLAQAQASTFNLGNGYSIMVLDADTAIWLIGVTPGQLTAGDVVFA
ncbi:MAG TPA: CARDB domain-containing protein [Caulobacterales bacterium]|nr:CARDB domain-containing protein [Caulobacterales bacterium]